MPRREYPLEWFKVFVKLGLAAVRLDVERLHHLSLGGHPAVTRSAVAGCKALGLPHNLNPGRPSDLYPWVLVLSSVAALRQAIRWRAEGRIEHLWAGPNLVVLPTEAEGILTHPLIERVLVPSRWVAEQYEQLMPVLQGRLLVWPAGVNLDQDWVSLKREFAARRDNLHVLHYLKFSSPRSDSPWFSFYDQVRVWLDVRLCQQSELVYGNHRQQHYRRELSDADVMLYWTDAGESQGLALLEAWAMDVPTFVVSNPYAMIKGVETCVSAAPYLSPACGNFFQSFDDLIALLEPLLHDETTHPYSPRSWVEANMQDHQCIKMLLQAFEFGLSPTASFR